MHRVSIHAVLHDGVAMKDIDWLVVWLTCSLVLYPTDRLGDSILTSMSGSTEAASFFGWA